MFYFVRRIANYLLTNKLPPRVTHPDLYPELRRNRPNPVPEKTGVNRPQIPRITNAHQPQVSREMDLYAGPLPPPKGSIRYMLGLPMETLMQQPPERKFVREKEPTSNTETQSSGDFHHVDVIIMNLPEPEPVSESGPRVSLPPHDFSDLTTNKLGDKAEQQAIRNKMDSDKIKVEYPPVRQYRGSDAPILLPDLRINSPENRRKSMQQNPDEDYVFMDGTMEFPGVPEPSDATQHSAAGPSNYDAGPSNVTRRSSAPPPEDKPCYIG